MNKLTNPLFFTFRGSCYGVSVILKFITIVNSSSKVRPTRHVIFTISPLHVLSLRRKDCVYMVVVWGESLGIGMVTVVLDRGR